MSQVTSNVLMFILSRYGIAFDGSFSLVEDTDGYKIPDFIFGAMPVDEKMPDGEAVIYYSQHQPHLPHCISSFLPLFVVAAPSPPPPPPRCRAIVACCFWLLFGWLCSNHAAGMDSGGGRASVMTRAGVQRQATGGERCSTLRYYSSSDPHPPLAPHCYGSSTHFPTARESMLGKLTRMGSIKIPGKASRSGSFAPGPVELLETAVNPYDVIPPQVFNLMSQPLQRVHKELLFEGHLFKLSMVLKAWKRRRVQLVANRLVHFKDDVATGVIDIKDVSVKLLPPDASAPAPFVFELHCSVAAENSGSGTGTERSKVRFAATSSEERDVWINLITTQSRRLAGHSACGDSPPIKVGSLKKQGHVMRTWRRRYFVLDMGILSYFEKEGEEKGFGTGQKGCINLCGAEVKWSPGLDRLYVTAGGEASKDLLVQADTEDIAAEWNKALRQHIRYANNMKKTTDAQAANARMNRKY